MCFKDLEMVWVVGAVGEWTRGEGSVAPFRRGVGVGVNDVWRRLRRR